MQFEVSKRELRGRLEDNRRGRKTEIEEKII